MSLLLTLNISHWTVDFYIWPVSLMQTLYKFHAFFVMLFVVIFILVWLLEMLLLQRKILHEFLSFLWNFYLAFDLLRFSMKTNYWLKLPRYLKSDWFLQVKF